LDYTKLPEATEIVSAIKTATQASLAHAFSITTAAITDFKLENSNGAVTASLLVAPDINGQEKLDELDQDLLERLSNIADINTVQTPGSITLTDKTVENGPGEPGITFLTELATEGSDVLQVMSSTGFTAGDTVLVGEEMTALKDVSDNTLTLSSSLDKQKVKGTPVRFVQEAPIVIVFQIKNLDSTSIMTQQALLNTVKSTIKDTVVGKLTMIETKAFASASATGNVLDSSSIGAFIDVELFAPFTSTFLCSITVAPLTGFIVTQFETSSLKADLSTALKGVNGLPDNLEVSPMDNLPGYSGGPAGKIDDASLLQASGDNETSHKAELLGMSEGESDPSKRQKLALMQARSVDSMRVTVEKSQYPEVAYVVEGRRIGVSLSEAAHKRRDLFLHLRNRLRRMDVSKSS
jgi:hypothetical protein